MNKSVLKVVESGIDLERQGLLRYLDLARKSRIIEGKNLFIQLAADEVEHWQMLEKLKKHLMDGDDYMAPKLKVYNVKELLPKMQKGAMEAKGDKKITEMDALKMALAFEKKASEFYENLAKSTDDAQTKKFAMDLSNWENTHYDLLQAQLDEINNSGFYFDMMEFDLATLRG